MTHEKIITRPNGDKTNDMIEFIDEATEITRQQFEFLKTRIMKLTPAQKEVVRKMREGAELMRDNNHYTISDGFREIQWPDVCYLIDSGIVEFLTKVGITKYYTLTDLGKKIDL